MKIPVLTYLLLFCAVCQLEILAQLLPNLLPSLIAQLTIVEVLVLPIPNDVMLLDGINKIVHGIAQVYSGCFQHFVVAHFAAFLVCCCFSRCFVCVCLCVEKTRAQATC